MKFTVDLTHNTEHVKSGPCSPWTAWRWSGVWWAPPPCRWQCWPPPRFLPGARCWSWPRHCPRLPDMSSPQHISTFILIHGLMLCDLDAGWLAADVAWPHEIYPLHLRAGGAAKWIGGDAWTEMISLTNLSWFDFYHAMLFIERRVTTNLDRDILTAVSHVMIRQGEMRQLR